MEDKKCLVRSKESDQVICKDCDKKGWWIDPAGDVHDPNEVPENFAKQYE